MTEDSPQKSFYAIIPANVRYDKNLPANAKLLYGEITALCNEKGYCWATNQYFADLYEVETETISRWISKLKNLGHIRTQILYKEGTKEITQRRIYIAEIFTATPIDKKINTSPQKNQYPIDLKVKDNITVNNTNELEREAHTPTHTITPEEKKSVRARRRTADEAAAYLDTPEALPEREITEAEKIYREIFPTVYLRPDQYRIFNEINNLDIWRKVCELWRDNGSRASMLGNMIDRYANEIKRMPKNDPIAKRRYIGNNTIEIDWNDPLNPFLGKAVIE